MAAPAFTNMLDVLYARLGEAAIYEAVDGSAPRQVQIKFDQAGGELLDGAHMGSQPTLRIAASEVPKGIRRDDAFTIGGTVYRARQDGLPLFDGAEYEVPLRRESA